MEDAGEPNLLAARPVMQRSYLDITLVADGCDSCQQQTRVRCREVVLELHPDMEDAGEHIFWQQCHTSSHGF
jgi:hypothetical protein